MHLWWDNSHRGKVIRYHSSERFQDEDLGKKALDLYSPKKFLLEDFKKFDLTFIKSFSKDMWTDLPKKFIKIFTPWAIYSYMCQAYSVCESIKLAKEDNTCSFLLRTRFDVILTKDIKSIIYTLNPDDDKIYFQSSMEGGHKYSGEPPNNPCDWFFCGSPIAVSKFSDYWFKSFPQLYTNGIIEARDNLKRTAELAGLQIILVDFGAIVNRQLHQEKNFVHWQKYLDDFDEQTGEIISNKEDWPHWVEYVDFKHVKHFD